MAHYVIFADIFKVTWRKNVTSYVNTERHSRKRNSMRNVLHPTRSLCHFRFKSYGPLSVLHKSGDLDLALYRIFKKKSSALSRVLDDIFCKKNQDDRTIRATCRAFEDRQTDKWQPLREWVLCEIASFSDCIIDIDYNMSMSILMYDLEIDPLLHWCFKDKNCKKINIWRHMTQKRYFVRNIGDNNPEQYFFKDHVAPN